MKTLYIAISDELYCQWLGLTHEVQFPINVLYSPITQVARFSRYQVMKSKVISSNKFDNF